ncbi:hypothetical protein LY76DRAFT_610039 [Colletotrichum caudatum]|nr:hypothetical protein LY76DRAFT_610039 [Colletotrichum caudatum]
MRTSRTMAVFGFSALVLAQSESLAPSPTESWGCQPHGDHWHCDGARSTTAAIYSTVVPASRSLFTPISIATVTTDRDHDHDHDHSPATGSYTLAPSPTESFGCEPHNDHWHCAGRIVTFTTTTATSPTSPTSPTSATSPTVTASVTVTPPASITVTGEGTAAARAGFGAAAVAAVAAFVAF